MAPGEHVVADYRSLGLSLKGHPLAFLRDRLAARGVVANARLANLPPGRTVKVAGLVLVRQRPDTASGVIFATLEDETAIANTIVWAQVFERFRHPFLAASLLCVEGPLQREGPVIHVVARRIVDLTHELRALADRGADGPVGLRSRDFH